MGKRCLVLFLCIAFGFLHSIAQPTKIHGQLRVVGTQLTDQQGHPVVLRGMSYGWHNFWPRFYNSGTVEWLYKDWHCSILRAAMGIEPGNGYLQDPEGSK